MVKSYHTILLPTRPQPDTAVAIFLLKKFGEEKFPGIKDAGIKISGVLPEGKSVGDLKNEGVLLLDLGSGEFDHHGKSTTASRLVAQALGIEDDPALAKILLYAERDDKFGKGTLSEDPIDKALGLSGLIASLNKTLPQNPERVVEVILPLIHAHYLEERKRTIELPKEFEEKSASGQAKIKEVVQRDKKLKVIFIEADGPSLVGYLRSSAGPKADVVVQRSNSGHVNILTRPMKRVDLRGVTALLRLHEAELRGIRLEGELLHLGSPGRISEVAEWYYDRATNSVLNGGIIPKGVNPTAIPWEDLEKIVVRGLGGDLSLGARGATSSRGEEERDNEAGEMEEEAVEDVPVAERSYFIEVRLPKIIGEKIRSAITTASPDLKIHRPENYHVTLLYLGAYEPQEMSGLKEKIQQALQGTKPFLLEFSEEDALDGNPAGYENGKAFYFQIQEEKGGAELKNLHERMKMHLPRFFIDLPFAPHLTFASAKDGSGDSEIELSGLGRIRYYVDSVRLTEVRKREDGKVVYRPWARFQLTG